MTHEELAKEHRDNYERAIKELFGSTEHFSGGQEKAYEFLETMIYDGYFKPSDLLLRIGYITEELYRRTGNKHYQHE